MYIALGVIAVLVIFIGVLLVRAARFTPKALPAVEVTEVTVDEQKAVQDMVDMIRCRTVSYRDDALIECAEYEKFEQLLKERFPRIFAACTFEKVGRTGLLFRLKGESDKAPVVLMAHYDVVPVEEAYWTVPAFDGLVKDGCIWGRGTLDTKSTLCGIMQAVEAALAENYIPKNDLYLAFSGEEEIDGDSCPQMVAHLEKNGVIPALVLDEGGAVVDNVFPGVKQPCALVGVAEKGSVHFELEQPATTGHASSPPPHTAVGVMAKAITRIEAHPFKCRVATAPAALFDTLGRHSSFLYRLIFANLRLFMPVLDILCKKTGGELNALLRTTAAVTRVQGSKASNVLPPKATCGINVRVMEGDSIQDAENHLRKAIKNDNISIRLIGGMDASITSDMHCAAYDLVVNAIRQTFPDAIVSPYLMLACSDSRHYCRITDKVYRFSPMHLSKQERGTIHGNDERIPIDALLQAVAFYKRLLKML